MKWEASVAKRPVRWIEGEDSEGLLLPGAPRAPPWDLNPKDFRREVYRTALRGETDFFSEVIVRS